jgi:hypothetical protein
LAGLFFTFIKIRSVFREFKDFITPPGENKPSKLALVVESITELMGRSLVAHLKAMLMGTKSGDAKADMAATGEMIDASPLGMIVNLLPKSVKRSLIKNPQILDYAMGILAKKQAPSDNHSGEMPSQVKFNL